MRKGLRARSIVAASAAVILAVAGIAATDVLTPFGGLVPGSSSALIPRDGLVLAPNQQPCPQPPPNSRCVARYAFAPDRYLGVWFTVRNGGAREITIDGVDDWIRSLPPDFIMRPTAVLDGGDPSRGFMGVGRPFAPIVLAPGTERIIGIELRTTGDVRLACAHWAPGTAVGWSEIPISWHWLATPQTTKIPLIRDVQVAAPNASDCPR